MSVPITPLPVSFTTNVVIDARAEDVEIRVDPSVVFIKPVVLPPGETIKYADLEGQDVGAALHIQKGSAVSLIVLLFGDKGDQLVEALVTSIIRGDPDKQERAEALLERFERAVKTGFETPARVPGGIDFDAGCIQDGGDNGETGSVERRSEDDLPCCTQDDISQ